MNAAIKLLFPFLVFKEEKKEKEESRSENEGGTLELLEVRQVKDQDRLVEVYVASYEKRYRIKPILSAVDRTVLTDLNRGLGFARTKAIVEHYLKMDNEWFVTKAHDLDTLKKNLNVINADFGLRTSKPHHGKAVIVTTAYCDNPKCRTYGQRKIMEVPIDHNFDRRLLCNECSSGVN